DSPMEKILAPRLIRPGLGTWATFLVPLLVAVAFAQPQPVPPPTAPDTLREVPVGETETPSTPRGAHDIGEEVITAAERLKVEDLKTPFFPLIDLYEPINAVLRLERYVFDDKLYSAIDSIGIPSNYLQSSYLRTPVVDRLIRSDVLVFLPSFDRSVADWELVVSNSNGETVRRVKRKGNPPNIVTWDGRDDKGSVINTGETYDFTFYAYDAIGNQTRIPGRPQRILGMLYQDGPEWVVTVAGDEIFEARGTRMLPGAGRWFDEIANVIKEKFKSEVAVFVYTEREDLSHDECQIVVSELKRRLVLPKDALLSAPRFIPGLQPKYSKIEIHIR
ncbi:MAG: hypothetical protein ABIK62_08295, partial [candidate division WOR-3 bacterium]